MELAKGTKLGPYEILAPIGAGGMGEVYRARDERLSREVAVKVLPPRVASDTDRLRRFEQEARAAGQLNHPNILGVFDVGADGEIHYVVTELLEGETLRRKLGGSPVAPRRAAEYAVQVAHGLAAAHEKGIVHRDLKPENIFVTRDGRVKILDFGLAKLTKTEPAPGGASELPTEGAATEPGAVMGTVGYMSPEQVRGQPADHRSDIFSFGTILYEMLSGRRPFQGDSAVEVMNAVLKEDPPEIETSGAILPPGFARVVRRCMEKSPEQRFQSAKDLAFNLESLSGDSVTQLPLVAEAAPKRQSRAGAILLVAVLAGLAGLAAGLLADRIGHHAPSSVTYRQVTFRQGTIFTARFSPDGDSIVYGAAWAGRPMELFVATRLAQGSRSLGLPGAEILSVSRSGEMAILLDRRFIAGWMTTGTLATAPLSGGVPREVLKDVSDADWHPTKGDMAVVHSVNGDWRLEYPVGHALYETHGWIEKPRFSPDGSRIAFLDHLSLGDDRGAVAVVDMQGRKETWSGTLPSATGIGWRPDGGEIWFSGTGTGTGSSIFATTGPGKVRVLATVPTDLAINDVSPGGEILVSAKTRRRGIVARAPGAADERDLSWMDWSHPIQISSDGKTVLFEEEGSGGGPKYATFIRGTDGSPAVRLGDGVARALSPDGQWVLTRDIDDSSRFVLLPTGAGQQRVLQVPGLHVTAAIFDPSGTRIVFVARPGEGSFGLYVTGTDGGEPAKISNEEVSGSNPIAISADGKLVAAKDPAGKGWIYPLDGGDRRSIEGLGPRENIVSWRKDNGDLFVLDSDAIPAKVFDLDPRTGTRKLWRG
ncbi:MAG TPA: protein kinase, partial [Candidatus Saccharimonadales bacterium]|nr:protein kinase [Candidatus Saccharimonadales bacterium]